MVNGSDGSYYGNCLFGGLTSTGSNKGNGVLFKLEPNYTFSVLKELTTIDGIFPSKFTFAADGNLYGVCRSGGLYPTYNGCSAYNSYTSGTIYKLSISGQYTKLRDITTIDGVLPGEICLANDGYFYGGSYCGGTLSNNNGTIFKFSTTGSYTVLKQLTGLEGINIYAGLTQASDGYLYGSCTDGGVNRSVNYGPYDGTMFKIDSLGNFFKILDLNTSVTGKLMYKKLIQSSDGDLYGTMFYGGLNNGGTIFKMSTSGSFTKLRDLSTIDGISPKSNLIQDIDGSFYGTCSSGGLYNRGTLFKITSTGNFTKILDFDSINTGLSPTFLSFVNPSVPFLNISPTYLSYTYYGGYKQINVNSNISWIVSCSSSIVGISSLSGINDKTLDISLPIYNNSLIGRNFTLSIIGNNIVKVLTINQSAIGYSSGGINTPPIVTTTSSIDISTKFESFKIYPNPNNGSFIIESKFGNAEFEVFNAYGTILFKKTLSIGENFIESNLNPGLYFINFNGNIYSKIMVE